MLISIKSLRKCTLEETFISIAEFVKTSRQANINLEDFVNSSQDDDAFDKSVRLIIINQVKLHQQVKLLLFKNDKTIIRSMVKCGWFFKTTPNSFFIEELLPITSVSTRLKVISALGKHVQDDRVDELYQYVRATFGHRAAEPLFTRLPECILKSKVTGDKTEPISPKCFINIAKRYPDLAVNICKEMSEKGRSAEIPAKVIKILIRHNFEVISKLSCVKQCLGRKSIKLMAAGRFGRLDPKQANLFNNCSEFLKRLNDSQIVEVMEIELRKYKQRNGVKLEAWNDFVSLWLGREIRFLTAERKENVVQSLFNNTFSRSIWDTPKAWNPEIVSYMTVNRRNLCLQQPTCQTRDWVFLKPPNEALSELKSAIRNSPQDDSRLETVGQMVKCCVLWSSLDSLSTVYDFVKVELGTNKKFCEQALKEFLKHFSKRKLPRNVWSSVIDLANLIGPHTRDEVVLKVYELWISQYLEDGELRLTSLVAPSDDEKKNLILTVQPSVRKQDPSAPKHFEQEQKLVAGPVQTTEKQTSTVQHGDTAVVETHWGQNSGAQPVYLSSIVEQWKNAIITYFQRETRSWSMMRIIYKPNEKLVKLLYPHLSEIDENIHENMTETFRWSILHSCQSSKVKLNELADDGDLLLRWYETLDDNYQHTLLDYLWAQPAARGDFIMKKYARGRNLLSVLRRHPSWLMTGDNLIEALSFEVRTRWMQSYCPLFRAPHLLDFYGLTEKIVKYFEESLSDPEKHCFELFNRYSYVGSVDKFIEFARPYLQTGKRIDKTAATAELSLKLIPMLGRLRPWEKVLPLVLPCIVGGGDLLYPALTPFQAYCFNVPLSEAREVILPFLRAPVSVMKKTVRMVCNMFPVVEAFRLIADEWEHCNHYSAKAVLLDSIVKLFRENPNQETWSTLRLCLSKSDEQVITADSIPDEFFSDFVLTSYSSLKSKGGLLSSINSKMALVDVEVCHLIIDQLLFTSKSADVDPFAVAYLLYGKGTPISRLDFVHKVFLDRFVSNHREVSNFISLLAATVKKGKHVDVGKLIIEKFKDDLDDPKLWEAHINLQYLELLLSFDNFENNSILPAIGSKIADFWLLTEDWLLLRPLFQRTLVSYFSNKTLPILLVGFVRNDPGLCLAALEVLPHSVLGAETLVADPDVSKIAWEDDFDKLVLSCHQFVVGSISKIDNSTVQFYLRDYLRFEIQEFRENFDEGLESCSSITS